MNISINTGSNGDIHLLAGAYAAGALDELDARRFEAHLSGCETCREDLAGFSLAIDELAREAEEPAPSELKAKVMDQVDQTRQVSVLSRAPQHRSGRSGRLTLMVASIAIIGAVISGGLFVRADQRADRLAEVASVYQADDATSVILPVESGAIRVSFSPTDRRAVIDSDDLSGLSEKEIYQLWVLVDGAIFAETTFSADDAADSLVFDLQNLVPDGALLAVTVEPAGGSEQPTTDPIAVSSPI